MILILKRDPTMRKICFVTSGRTYMPPIRGGAVAQLVHLILSENERAPRFEITVICHANPDTVELQRAFRYTQFINVTTWGANFYKFVWKVRGLLKRITGKSYYYLHVYEGKVDRYLLRHASEYDLVIAEACDPNQFFHAARCHGRNLFCLHAHNTFPSNKGLDYCHGSLLAVSECEHRTYAGTSSLPPHRMITLLNGIDVAKFAKTRHEDYYDKLRGELGFEKDDFVVVFCGRIVPIKGVLELIEAVLKIDDPRLKLLIVGSSDFGLGNSGSYVGRVKELSLGHPDRIKYTGFIANDLMGDYYHLARVGVVPSTGVEGLPLVLLEMMAAGLPTVATPIGGMREAGTDATTIFVDNDEHLVDNISKNILSFMENEDLRSACAAAARERAAFFDKTEYFLRFSEAVDKLVEDNCGARREKSRGLARDSSEARPASGEYNGGA